MNLRMLPLTFIRFIVPLAMAAAVHADPGMDFFERKVRPLLEEHCMDCHSPAKKVKGGLRLDTRDGWLKGGDAGPAIVPGEPDKSLLIDAIRYTDTDLQMPEKRKLPAGDIAIFEQWVKMGAPDPRAGGEVAAKQAGLSIEEGKKFWAYVPPQNSCRASGEKFRVGTQRHRSVYTREDGARRDCARPRRDAGSPCTEAHFQSYRTAADSGATCGVRGGDASESPIRDGTVCGRASRRAGISARRGGGTGWTLRALPSRAAGDALCFSRMRGVIGIM